jgi:hypothetical protein
MNPTILWYLINLKIENQQPPEARNLNIIIFSLEGSRLSTLGPHLENALSSL